MWIFDWIKDWFKEYRVIILGLVVLLFWLALPRFIGPYDDHILSTFVAAGAIGLYYHRRKQIQEHSQIVNELCIKLNAYQRHFGVDGQEDEDEIVEKYKEEVANPEIIRRLI